jgi:hypothetical protein
LLQQNSNGWIAMIEEAERMRHVKRAFAPSVTISSCKRCLVIPFKTLSSNARKVLEEVMLQQGFLHWNDARAFGSASKECRAIYKKHTNVIYKPLLTHLESMIRSDRHDGCGEVLAPATKRTCKCPYPDDAIFMQQHLVALDPRYQRGYESWPTLCKCRQMVAFLAKIVTNVTREFDFDDISNPRKLPECIRNPDWELGWRFEESIDIIRRNPNRASLAFVIVLLRLVEGDIIHGTGRYANDAMLGIGPIDPIENNWTRRFGLTMSAIVRGSLIPLRDQEFVRFLRNAYPSEESLTLLGPLVSKTVLMAPLFCWVSPEGWEEECNLSQLPTKLEDLEGSEN